MDNEFRFLGATEEQWAVMFAWAEIENPSLDDALDVLRDWKVAFHDLPDEKQRIDGAKRKANYGAVCSFLSDKRVMQVISHG